VESDKGGSESSLFRAALAHLATGIHLVDGQGRAIYSDYVTKFGGSSISRRILIERAVARVLGATQKDGDIHEIDQNLFGPPRSHFRLRAQPLNQTTSPPILVSIEDVTKQHYLEGVRRDFVANVSHELKTPVGALIVLADAMVNENDVAVLQRLARRILAEGDRLSRLTGDLLDLSRIEESMHVDLELVDIDEVIRDCLAGSQDIAQAKSITLIANHPATPATVIGEKAQLVSAFSNLLDNAVKYSDEGTTVRASVMVNEDNVSVRIVDQGIGIPARDVTRIFERFYRVDADRSRATGGTGLGLSIVKHVIENHQGTIDLTSTEGVGTTFVVTLPFSSELA
jgi:two-component system sensor histidine kinase SenX3